MSSRLERSPWVPWGWWAMLAAVLATGLVGHWALATGLLIVLLVHVARPFDFLVAFILVTGGASFVRGAAGQLTFELRLLTGAILLMLACYVVSIRRQALTISRNRLTWPLFLYLVLSIANALRGLLCGYSPKWIGLDLMPVLGLASALVVANAFEPRRDLRLAVVGVLAVGFANAIVTLSSNKFAPMHKVGVYDAAVPGIVGLLLVNFSLRSRTPVTALGWIALSLPLFLHQFLTYGRGLWLACLAGLAFSVLVFTGFGPSSVARWRRSSVVVGTLAVFVLMLGFFLGTQFLQVAGSRLVSITRTEYSYETASNAARLIEYSTVVGLISHSPWLGYGLGYTFLGSSLFGLRHEQSWVHENFLLVWLKQGLVGLAVFVWMLWTAVTLGVREAQRPRDYWESAWLAASAAGTVMLAVLSLSNFPLNVVNPVFLLALLWGGSIAMTREGFVRFRWFAPGTTGGTP